jgi:radical SAM protein with 4Fe4S-binding SPASM domain
MNQIHIATWLLTRRCNLKCSYCRISKTYANDPYSVKTLLKKDIDFSYLIDSICRIKSNNPESYNIFLGGEPTQYRELKDLVLRCNKENILYTIVSNMSGSSLETIKDLLTSLDYIDGISFSLDPVVFMSSGRGGGGGGDRTKKSSNALNSIKFLMDQSGKKVRDIVAEVVSDAKSLAFLPGLVSYLTGAGVWSSVSVVESGETNYYDFAEVLDPKLLIKPNNVSRTVFSYVLKEARKGNLKVLAHESLVVLMDCIENQKPYMCNIEENANNLVIDSDGSLRLCLRLRGTESTKFKVTDILNKDGSIHEENMNRFKDALRKDKELYCKGCLWTCMMFSDLLANKTIQSKDIHHLLKG